MAKKTWLSMAELHHQLVNHLLRPNEPFLLLCQIVMTAQEATATAAKNGQCPLLMGVTSSMAPVVRLAQK
jgi:Na+/H+ antiporter NhaB